MAGHWTHWLLPERAYPSWHVQTGEPGAEYEYAGHVTATEDPAAQYELAGHDEAMPPTQKLPAGHVLADPLAHTLLLGQASHSQPPRRSKGFVTFNSPALQTHADPTSAAPLGQAHWLWLKAPASEYRPTAHAPIWAPPVQNELTGHRLHVPPAGPVYPGLHWHCEISVAPAAEVLLLAGQLLGEVDDAEQKKPKGHVTATDEPLAQKAPEGHATATPFWQKVPAAQVAGADDMGRQTVPVGHAVALAAPAGQKNCVGHGLEIPFWQK